MPEVQEVFRLATQKVRPDPGALEPLSANALRRAREQFTWSAKAERVVELYRWLLDRFWLRMSPTSRRVSLLIVGMETLALLLFIAILVVYRFIG